MSQLSNVNIVREKVTKVKRYFQFSLSFAKTIKTAKEKGTKT
ncbi:hypothetical protein AWRIB429_0651 [Oenococcus oeni AWRIB429]|uniref:Uncharacterized protein n=1 Tax=Oenococcus oeni AWRIB429 TaxID=655225 RepID=D3L8H1_OENOE|nr:hypothetical protein AWRIB429_0651 [Oenococcus oeni AWRIB429]